MSNSTTALVAPPWSEEAEQSTLGAVLLDNAAWAEVAHLGPRAFYRPAHRVLFETMGTLADAGEPIDVLTVTDALRVRGLTEKVDPVYVAEVCEATPAACNAGAYAKRVRRDATLRAQIAGASRLTEAAHARDLEGVAEAVAQIADADTGAGEGLTSDADLAAMVFPDEWIVSKLIQRGDVVLLSAGPKAGKSTLARQLAAAIANPSPAWWLGRRIEVTGSVLYCALDEPPRLVQKHRGVLAAKFDTSRCAWLLRPEFTGWEQIEALARRVRPVALFVDTMGKAVGLEESYGEQLARMGLFTRLADTTDAAVIVLHHNRKREGEEHGGANALGTTAVAAEPSVLINIARDGEGTGDDVGSGRRWISSEGRDGENLRRAALVMGDDGLLALGGTRREETIRKARATVLRAVTDKPNGTGPEVLEAASGDRTLMHQTMTALVADGLVIQSGRGVRGDPKRYSVNPENDSVYP